VTLGIFEAKYTMNNPRTHGCRSGNRHNFWRREHFQVERSRNSGGRSWIRRVQSHFSANNYLGICSNQQQILENALNFCALT